jgi:hypothetical protein
MAQVPTNTRLWAMIITQAKAKYTNYPNPGASHWVHQQYIKNGGKFEDTSEETRRKKIMSRQFSSKREERIQELKAKKAELKKKLHKKDSKHDKKDD